LKDYPVTTDADNHPVTPNAIQSVNNGGGGIFITVFDSTLRNMKFSTYLGGKDQVIALLISIRRAILSGLYRIIRFFDSIGSL
jgi:hypothetical protein